MRIKLVDAVLPFHPTLRYRSQPLQAVGFRADGSPLWPMMGSDGGEGEGEGESEDEGDGEPEDEEDGSEGEGSESKKKGKPSDKSETVSRAEYEALKKRMSAADKNKSKAERALEELQRKERSDLENAQTDLQKITEERDGLQKRFASLALTNAFLTASQQEGITWHDPKVAQVAADLAELEIDEDGSVAGIREVVKKLAEDKKFLVNSGSQEGSSGTGKRGASGSGVGSGKTKTKAENNGKLTDAQLLKRFPGIRTR